MVLLHGTADKSVPPAGSEAMHGALQGVGCTSSLLLLPGKTHTDLLLEDAMAGGPDLLADSILGAIRGREQQRPRSINYPCMCPRVLVRAAGWVCPF